MNGDVITITIMYVVPDFIASCSVWKINEWQSVWGVFSLKIDPHVPVQSALGEIKAEQNCGSHTSLEKLGTSLELLLYDQASVR